MTIRYCDFCGAPETPSMKVEPEALKMGHRTLDACPGCKRRLEGIVANRAWEEPKPKKAAA